MTLHTSAIADVAVMLGRVRILLLKCSNYRGRVQLPLSTGVSTVSRGARKVTYRLRTLAL